MKNLISKAKSLFSDYIANWKQGALVLLAIGMVGLMTAFVVALSAAVLIFVLGLKESTDTTVLAFIISAPAYLGFSRKTLINLIQIGSDNKV